MLILGSAEFPTGSCSKSAGRHGTKREGLIDLGGAAAADFLFEFDDVLPGRFELPLEGHDDVDQVIDADASLGGV